MNDASLLFDVADGVVAGDLVETGILHDLIANVREQIISGVVRKEIHITCAQRGERHGSQMMAS